MVIGEHLYILYETTNTSKPLVRYISLNKDSVLRIKNTVAQLEPNKVFYITKQKV